MLSFPTDGRCMAVQASPLQSTHLARSERAHHLSRISRCPPFLAQVYGAKIATLADSLNNEATKSEAILLLRGLVTEVRMIPETTTLNGDIIDIKWRFGGNSSIVGSPNAKNPPFDGRGNGFLGCGRVQPPKPTCNLRGGLICRFRSRACSR